MRRNILIILYFTLAFALAGCADSGEGRGRSAQQPADSVFAVELARAKSYSSEQEGNLDSARIILECLVRQDGLTLEQQSDVLGQLVYVSRLRQNDENALNYGIQYIEVCRQLGEETENREWWEISIDGSQMHWTALRQNADGQRFTATFEMEKVN